MRAGAGRELSSTAPRTVLERILAETREEVERRKRELPLDAGAGGAGACTSAGVRRFRDALAREGIGVIAEFKRRSPSAGALRERPELAEIVSAYQRGGAVAVSVLTEGPNFEGALEDLRTARAACELPLLRKDFIVDPYQLHEALRGRRRRGAADRGGARGAASWRRCTRRRGRSGWTCSSRFTTATSCASRSRSARRSSGSTTATCATSASRWSARRR